MKIHLPHTLGSNSSTEDIIDNLNALVDVLHHGLDGDNVTLNTALGTATQPRFFNRYSLVPLVSCYERDPTAANTVVGGLFSTGTLSAVGGVIIDAKLFASSIWHDGVAIGAGSIRYIHSAPGGTTVFHDQNGVAANGHYTQYYSNAGAIGEDGAVLANLYTFTRNQDASGARHIVAVGWLKATLGIFVG